MKKKSLVFTGILTALLIIFLIGAKSYFNQKEINAANSGCEQAGGHPIVEEGFLTLDYNYHCE